MEKFVKTFKLPTQIVKLELTIKKKSGKDYKTMKTGTFDVLSISGDSAQRTKGRPRWDSAGQIYDSIEMPTPNLKKIITIWKKWHLNDLTAGSKRQEDALNKWRGRPKGWSYDEDVQFLKKKRLYNDKGYKYGSAWLVRPLPSKVKSDIKKLFR